MRFDSRSSYVEIRFSIHAEKFSIPAELDLELDEGEKRTVRPQSARDSNARGRGLKSTPLRSDGMITL